MFLESETEKQNNNNNQDLDFVIASFGGQQLKHIDLVIDKNRYNAPCKIELDFNGEYSSFTTRK